MLRLMFIAVFCLTSAAQAQEAQQPTTDVPIPSQLADAKKVFVSNVGADAEAVAVFTRLGQHDFPYVRFYSEIKKWGKYELVTTPADADLVFQISFSAPISKCDDLTVREPQFGLSILDSKTHFTLWSLTAPIHGALRKASIQKNLDQGMADLVADLKKLVAQTSLSVSVARVTETRFTSGLRGISASRAARIASTSSWSLLTFVPYFRI